jgi:streptomycin 6-kinase
MILPRSLREGVIAWMADGQEWADSLPARVERFRRRWELTVGEPFEGGCTAWVAPAERSDGSPCVLKLPYTGEGPTYEADALRAWAGEGAVRLLERDEETGVLLLERLLPGSSLYGCAEPEEALLLACGALRRLWVPAPARPFPTAHARATLWAAEVERRFHTHSRPFDVELTRAAVAAFEHLSTYTGECVLLHQDFHRGNILRAQREPWLAIDPKPLAGERAFDARWLLRDLLYREPRIALPVPDLLERLAAELALDGERVRLWTLARAVENALWCYEIDEDPADDLALASALL